MTISIDKFVDPSAGLDTNSGASWALAYKTLKKGVDNITAGQVIAVRAFSDQIAFNDLTGLPTTLTARCMIFGVATGFSGTVIADTDILDEGDTLPLIEGTTGDVDFWGVGAWYGLRFDAGDDIHLYSDGGIIANSQHFYGCTFKVGEGSTALKGIYCGSPTTENNSGTFKFEHCIFEGTDQADDFIFVVGHSSNIEVHGGSTTGDLFNEVISEASLGGNIEFRGFDFSSMPTSVTFLDLNDPKGMRCGIYNCKLPSSWTVVTGSIASGRWDFILDIVQSDNSTHSVVFDQFERYTYPGTIIDEATIKPAGDRSSLKFDVRASIGDQDTGWGIAGPWMAVRVAAEATTITIPINNDGAGDLDDSEVFAEFIHPPTTGAAATSAYDKTTTFAGAGASAVTVTDDTVTDWGGSDPGKGQKIAITKTFDYPGYMLCRVVFCQDSATPDTLYVGRPVKT